MERIIVKSDTLENALNKASYELNLPVEQLNYNIISRKSSLFKKRIEIEVTPKNIIDKRGFVSIIKGKFVIEDPKEGGAPATINIPDALELYKDNKRVYGKVEVLEKNDLNYSIDKKQAERNLLIRTSEDYMKASLWISYEPEIVYEIDDAEKSSSINIKIIEKERRYPPKFSKEEIIKAIKDEGIIFGILEDKIDEIESMEVVENITIAKGKEAIDDIGDKLNIFFDESTKSKENEDLAKADYKNFYSIANIEAQNTIAELIHGTKGEDGKDIFGRDKKRKTFSEITLKCGEGCYIDGDKVISSIAGRPCVKNGTFYVYKVLNQDMDVDMKSGNIHFIGDVHIRGDIKDGMTVTAGNSLIVEKNIEGALLTSKGEMTLKGNAIRSRIIAGGDNTIVMNEVSLLKGIKEDLTELIETVTQIKERNMRSNQIKDGEIIMTLLEKKFKRLNSKIMILLMNTQIDAPELKVLLKNKLFSLGVTKIKSYNELYEITDTLDNRINTLSSELKLPVNLYINNCQDSNIECSGDIMVTGKGSYLSNISAQGSVYFKNTNSIVRGGSVKANKEIKCRIVGSVGGGKTTLITGKEGHIYADVVYMGTKFIIGTREYVVDIPCKNVHGYLDQHGDINIDKFVL